MKSPGSYPPSDRAPGVPPDFERRWRNRFEQFGNVFDDDAAIAGWTQSGLETRFRNFRHYFTTAVAGQLWLDVGCGAGTYTRWLHEQGARAIGVDYSVPSLTKAAKRSDKGIGWVAADAMQLPIPAQCADGVLCFGVLQAVASPFVVLTSLREVLKSGGTLWIDALNAHCVPNRRAIRQRLRSGMQAHLRYDGADELRKVVHSAGFDIAAMHWLPVLPAALGMLQPLLETRGMRALFRRAPVLANPMTHSLLFEARRV